MTKPYDVKDGKGRAVLHVDSDGTMRAPHGYLWRAVLDSGTFPECQEADGSTMHRHVTYQDERRCRCCLVDVRGILSLNVPIEVK